MKNSSIFQRSGTVLLESHPALKRQKSWLFEDPVEILATDTLQEIPEILEKIDESAERGMYIAGYMAYEAAPAFEPAAKVRSSSPVPLCWFGVYHDRKSVRAGELDCTGDYNLGEWQSSVSFDEYKSAIGRVRKYIKSGDTYQVNYTFRLHSNFKGDAFRCYKNMFNAQQSAYTAFLNTGRHMILSASPELFFQLSGDSLESMPMKGTGPRGRRMAEDEVLRMALAGSEKNKAENVMIVDMIRNDMSRIAAKNSVKVRNLFRVDLYPTLMQMISIVKCRTTASISEIFGALFPCASITGAPKIRTMQIISELESEPRGVYCGAIGYVGPGRDAKFSVAIRTLTIDSVTGRADYGTGGGITWDSTSESEYEECSIKAEILFDKTPAFDLLETILYDGLAGFFLLDRHLARMSDSAAYFRYLFNAGRVRKKLDEAVKKLDKSKYRVRLLLTNRGEVKVQAMPLDTVVEKPMIGLSKISVKSSNKFLYHKTTNRHVYEEAAKSRPDCDDVVLCNERGEITETCIANIVVVIGGRLYTPPVECGLLPGVLRGEMLEKGDVEERVLYPGDLEKAEQIFLVNSLRGRREAVWVG